MARSRCGILAEYPIVNTDNPATARAPVHQLEPGVKVWADPNTGYCDDTGPRGTYYAAVVL